MRGKQIWEALHPVDTGGKSLSTCLSDGRKAGPQHEQGFAAATATAAGMTKQAINQHLARAEALGDDLERITGTRKDFTPSERVEVTCDLITSDALAAGTPARVEGALPAGRHLTIR